MAPSSGQPAYPVAAATTCVTPSHRPTADSGRNGLGLASSPATPTKPSPTTPRASRCGPDRVRSLTGATAVSTAHLPYFSLKPRSQALISSFIPTPPSRSLLGTGAVGHGGEVAW